MVTRALASFVLAGLVACSDATAPSDEVRPITIERVDVRVLESSPPQAIARVRGVTGPDACWQLSGEPKQERDGRTVTITILARRMRDVICAQVVQVYDADVRLTGTYPPGEYLLKVNDFQTRFTTQ